MTSAVGQIWRWWFHRANRYTFKMLKVRDELRWLTLVPVVQMGRGPALLQLCFSWTEASFFLFCLATLHANTAQVYFKVQTTQEKIKTQIWGFGLQRVIFSHEIQMGDERGVCLVVVTHHPSCCLMGYFVPVVFKFVWFAVETLWQRCFVFQNTTVATMCR